MNNLTNEFLISILSFLQFGKFQSHFENTLHSVIPNEHCVLFPLFLSRNSYFLHGCMHNYLPTSLLHLNMKWKRWSCWWGDSAAAARFKEKEENREERGKKTFPLFSYVAVTSNICKSRQKKNVKWWPQAKLLDSSLRWYAILRLYLCSHLPFLEFIVNNLPSFTLKIFLIKS